MTALGSSFRARAWDEAFDDHGAPRAHYEEALAALEHAGPTGFARDVTAGVERDAITHGEGEGEHHYLVDAVPRVLTAAEWEELAAAVAQRVRALDLFVADVYGARTSIEAGVVPAEVIEGSSFWEPDMLEVPTPVVRIAVAGPDVVRDEDGVFVVLEDNVRTPTLMGYALAARRLVGDRLDVARAPRPIAEPLAELALWALRGAAPELEDAALALLSDGRKSGVRWELDALGAHLDIPVVEPHELRLAGDRLVRREGGEPVDVLWRRTSAECARWEDGRPTELGELLLPALRAGTLRMVNAFGTGVADDKRTYPYVEELVRFFLGEEPLIRSVPTWDATEPAQREEILDRLPELVVKPRGGSGGFGVVIGPVATPEQIGEARRAIEEEPEGFLVQTAIPFSHHPTFLDGELRPRHVDVRPFAFSDGSEVRLLPGGISRWPLREDALVTNSIQGGGAKDVWVLPD